MIPRVLYDNSLTNWFIGANSYVNYMMQKISNKRGSLGNNFYPTYGEYRRLSFRYRSVPLELPFFREIKRRISYLNYTYVLFHEHYREEIFEIKDLIFGPFYNYYLLCKWRFKRYTIFPARYLFSSISEATSNHLIIESPKQETKENTEQPISTIRSGNEDLIFPREVWLEIAQYDVDILPLMFVNQALLDIFAPFIYGDVHGIFVVSSLEKMWASDECFLRNGPDTEDSDIDGYEIYMRNKESRNYAYEALDISYKGAKYGYGLIRTTREDEIVDEEYEDAGPSFPSVSYSLNRDSTIVSCYSGLNCIITQILKNPGSIMKKYLRKFSIDIMVLSDIDKFREELDTLIEDAPSELKNHRLDFKNAPLSLNLSSGYDDFSDNRIGKRYKMRKDLEIPKFLKPRTTQQLILEAQTIKKKFKTIYHKELFGVAQLFESLLKPPAKTMDRRTFEYRNSGRLYNWNFVLWKSGISESQLQLMYSSEENKNDYGEGIRMVTDFFASSLEIKDRTFLCQDTMDEFCRLVGELSCTDPTKGHPNYSFMIHGMRYSNYTESFSIYDSCFKHCYDSCKAASEISLLTNTAPNNLVILKPERDTQI